MKKLSKSLWFLFILGIVFTLACEKSIFKRHAKGLVTDITDGSPVPFAEIAIQNEDSEFLGGRKRKF